MYIFLYFPILGSFTLFCFSCIFLVLGSLPNSLFLSIFGQIVFFFPVFYGEPRVQGMWQCAACCIITMSPIRVLAITFLTILTSIGRDMKGLEMTPILVCCFCMVTQIQLSYNSFCYFLILSRSPCQAATLGDPSYMSQLGHDVFPRQFSLDSRWNCFQYSIAFITRYYVNFTMSSLVHSKLLGRMIFFVNIFYFSWFVTLTALSEKSLATVFSFTVDLRSDHSNSIPFSIFYLSCYFSFDLY